MTSDTFKEKHNPQEAKAHTAGTWDIFTIVSPDAESYRIFRKGSPAIDIAHIPAAWANPANARLIAAAPELLAALEALGRAVTSDGELSFIERNVAVLRQAQAAVQKARDA